MSSSSDFLPKQDLAFQAWLTNFATQALKYESELDLSADDILAINSFVTTFGTDLEIVDETKETLKGHVATKNSDRADISADIRSFARRFKGISGISPGILSALGIVSSSSLGPVVTVNNLVVTGCSTGMNSLSWNRNNNGSGTQFIIESSANGTTNWDLVAVTTRVTYDHKNQVPGVQKFYRVTSTRAGDISNPSQAAVVYQNGGSNTLQIAA